MIPVMSGCRLWISVLNIVLVLLLSVEGKAIHKVLPCENDKVEPFVRRLVANASYLLPNPVHLPRHEGFVILTEGKVTGLSSLRPNHTTKITCKDNLVEIRAHLIVNELSGKYKWLRNLLTRTLDGTVSLNAKKFEVYVQINQNMTETQLRVETCYVTLMEDIDIVVTGEEFITWPLARITSPAKKAFEDVVHETVSDSFKDALSKQLEDVILAVKSWKTFTSRVKI